MDQKSHQSCAFQRTCFNTSAVFLGLLVAGLSGGCQPQPLTSAELESQCRQAIAKQDFDTARALADRIPVKSSAWLTAKLDLGAALTKAREFQAAIDAYRPIVEQRANQEAALQATFFIADLERELGQLALAEAHYGLVLSKATEDVATRERLAFLLTTSGRAWDAVPHYLSIVKAGTANYTDLCLLGELERSFDRADYLQTCAEKAPEDPVVQLGLAAHHYWEGDLSEAEAGFRKVLADHPGYLAGQAMLGEMLINRDDAEFLKWHEALPAAASQHPRIWLTRGLWARRHQDFEVATYCFWQALRLEPTSRRATTQMSQVLLLLNHPAHAEFETRARDLARLTQLIDEVLRSEARNESAFREAAEILERSGRIWEACAWSMLAQQNFPNAVWPAALFERRAALLVPELPQVAASENLTRKYEFTDFPGPERLLEQVRQRQFAAPELLSPAKIRFHEDERGPKFVYDNGGDPATPGARMFEQTGGGVAVIDYDGDRLPDLFFPQGKEWPTGSVRPGNSPSLNDTLYRQFPPESLHDVTSLVFPTDHGFGQGCTVGDFDNDGFPDLYVANVGRNQLLQNQGDGTFVDITESAGLTRTDWTASVVVVDLNGDGFPDLFDVNYLSGEGISEMICGGKACSPSVFQGTPARLMLNQANGTFVDVPYGPDVRPGKGLGVVCLPLDSQRYLSLFISNDQVANQLLQNSEPQSGAIVNLIDQAFVMGTAFNGDGVAMAGMGIAADDVDGNGTTDFYVSNFRDESNTLLLLDGPGIFLDSTNVAGLKAASVPYVGWGTQFLDADRDALVDLVLTNGHVDDYRGEGGEYQMRPQCFHQEQSTRFVELLEREAGSFFAQKRLGRGLARLDWNQDGLMDFVVSQIGDRASLLTNTTTGAGHFLNVRLIATTTARDAIGAKVTVTADDESHWTKPLLCGDGYMASNERILQFGLGSRTKIRDIQIAWPSGAVCRLKSPTVDGTILFVEGMPNAFSENGTAEPGQAVERTASPNPN